MTKRLNAAVVDAGGGDTNAAAQMRLVLRSPGDGNVPLASGFRLALVVYARVGARV